MRKSPTDLQFLEHIYSEYYKTFVSFSGKTTERPTKNYVPINVADVAREFDVDGDIVFGRLYYHLQEKYGLRRGDGILVPFFEFHDDAPIEWRHQIHFPMLAAAIASLREARIQYLIPTWLAAGSLAFSMIALCVGFLNLGG